VPVEYRPAFHCPTATVWLVVTYDPAEAAQRIGVSVALIKRAAERGDRKGPHAPT
jgi:hypothetical protein